MPQTGNLTFERVEHLAIKQMGEAFVDGGDFERAFLPGVEEVVFARSGYVELGEVASILIKHQFPRVFRIVEDIDLSKEVSSRQDGGGRVTRESTLHRERNTRILFRKEPSGGVVDFGHLCNFWGCEKSE